MAIQEFSFATGTAQLDAVGKLEYNGCDFSPLFATTVNGIAVKDEANRTVKYMEYTLTADGYVTLPSGQNDIVNAMKELRALLSAQGGSLIYKGRGNDIVVNTPGSKVTDVAWGPVPEVLDFTPLGVGKSAHIVWQVKVRIPEESANANPKPVLQFNQENTVTYGEDGYSTLSIRGTLEIPLTRTTQDERVSQTTVDSYRVAWLDPVAQSIDLTRFRMTRREFHVSRDRRTLAWEFVAEELPPMGLPSDSMLARGTFTFRPLKSGLGLMNWICSLRVTYTIRKDQPRRLAWTAFLMLLRQRMAQSQAGNIPQGANGQNPNGVNIPNAFFNGVVFGVLGPAAFFQRNLQDQNQAVNRLNKRKCMLLDLSGEEGIYLDSKTTAFFASWRLITTLSSILAASGLWRQVPTDGGNNWKQSVQDVSGAKSWLLNVLNPEDDIIVDFGGGG